MTRKKNLPQKCPWCDQILEPDQSVMPMTDTPKPPDRDAGEMIDAAIAAERERCASIAETNTPNPAGGDGYRCKHGV